MMRALRALSRLRMLSDSLVGRSRLDAFYCPLRDRFCRAQGTYWLGRGAARGALAGAGKDGVRGSIARWFNGPTPKRGAKLLDTWGLIIIPLCFLTVGIQTAVNAGAGLVSMK